MPRTPLAQITNLGNPGLTMAGTPVTPASGEQSASQKMLLEEVPLSEELLNAIGKRINEERPLAPSLHSQFAVLWQDVIEKGLPDEERNKLIDKYPLPENCLFSDPPKMNMEIKTVVQPPVVNRDTRIILKQQKIAAALSALAKVLSSLVKDGKDLQEIPTIECLSDAIRLLADIQRDESLIRRSLIISNINVSLRDALTQTKCGNFLFGEKLEEIIKSAKALESTVKELRPKSKAPSSKAPKNSGAPPRQQAKDQSKTAGGQKTGKRSKKPYDRPQRSNDTRHQSSRDQEYQQRRQRHR